MTHLTEKNGSGCFNESGLAIYLDGEAGAQAKERIDAHLESCDRCRELVKRLQEENRCIGAAFEPAELCGTNLVPGVMAAISADEESTVIPFSRLRQVLPYAAAILIVGVLLVFALLFFQGSGTGSGETRVILCSARVGGQKAEGFTFKDNDEPDIQFIWLEKE